MNANYLAFDHHRDDHRDDDRDDEVEELSAAELAELLDDDDLGADLHEVAAPTFAEDVATASAAIARGDLVHAIHHVAGAVASGADRAACATLIDALVAAAGPDPLAQVPSTELWFGLSALKAELLARAGRHAEAVPLLLASVAAVPDAPFLPWLATWLATPGVIAALDPHEVACQLVACAADEGLALALHGHARRIHEAHPDHDELAFAAIELHRACGRNRPAIAIGLAALAHRPRPRAAIGLASALRADGDQLGAIAALRVALREVPDRTDLLLDLGDLHLELGALADALTAYDAVLADDPDEPWAAPSRRFVRWRQTHATADADALHAYVDDHPDNPRATALVDEMTRR